MLMGLMALLANPMVRLMQACGRAATIAAHRDAAKNSAGFRASLPL